MKVGTKELKDNLSYYLRQVRRGEVVFVMDRGTVVAQIRRVTEAPDDEEAALDALAAEGIITRGAGRPAAFEPVDVGPGARVSRSIVEDRR